MKIRQNISYNPTTTAGRKTQPGATWDPKLPAVVVSAGGLGINVIVPDIFDGVPESDGESDGVTDGKRLAMSRSAVSVCPCRFEAVLWNSRCG